MFCGGLEFFDGLDLIVCEGNDAHAVKSTFFFFV